MYCKQCNTEKDVSAFPNNRSKISGKGSTCIKCLYTRLVEWRKNNPEKLSNQGKRRYIRKKVSYGRESC